MRLSLAFRKCSLNVYFEFLSAFAGHMDKCSFYTAFGNRVLRIVPAATVWTVMSILTKLRYFFLEAQLTQKQRCRLFHVLVLHGIARNHAIDRFVWLGEEHIQSP